MIAAVHALMGAVIGRISGNRVKSFAAGVSSHLIADMLPHKDFSLRVEVPLLAITMGFLAWRFGLTSAEVVGASGAVSPDIENGLKMLKIIPDDAPVFPTHRDEGRFHGPETASRLPQGFIAAACIWYLLTHGESGEDSR